ncbi:DUF4924 family protein [Persicobacter sp. CCB-QB2]|uniref:DUF4924 family protein n=1 Tax=Persicobacter sp. CCB-QB2 TaxID=1561025 RepID=UPI00092E4C37|nr:DUF4924 family protein [Persicobacter sp. CCB-QB2]
MKEIAAKRRSENISEYILFLYQMEDLVRAFNFDMEQMEEYVVKHFPVEEEEKEAQRKWFSALIRQMKAEGVEQSGHLASTQAEVDKVFDLHMKLLVEDAEYQKLFNAVRPSIQFYLQKSEGKVSNPMQVCINGLYGYLLCKMTGKPVSEEDKKHVEAFGDLLAYLSYNFKALAL